MSTGTLDDLRVTHARLNVPAWGCPYAEVDVDGEHTLTGSVTLKIADLTLVGTVLSGGPDNGRSRFRVVGGKGGWGKSIPAKSYANDAGVKVSTLITDAAAACGESVLASTLPTSRVGPAWARREDSASRVLALLVPSAWYVGTDGVTRIGARAASALPAGVTHGPVDRARATVTLASESIASILPGLVVDGLTVVDVVHELTPDGLRSTVYGAKGGGSRAHAAMREILAQLDPFREYRGVTEYRVESVSGERVALTPALVSSAMPDLGRVVARPGLPGCKGVAKVGSRVLVGFVNSDPARPYVAAYEDAEGSGYAATSLNLCGTAGSPFAARVGDSVTVTLVNVVAGPLPVPPSATAVISGGSSKVRIGG